MYRIIAYNEPTDKVGYIIHDPRIDRRVSAGKLTLKEGEIDDLTLKVNQKNNLFNNVRPMRTHVEVYDDSELIFRGRALKPTRTMEFSGQFMQEYVFESIEAYLLDSVQRFAEVHNTTPADFFRMLIQVHNNSVPDWKKFEVRNVDVTNSTDNVYRFVDYAKTRDTIKEKLLSRLGGFLRVEYRDGKNYVDYVIDPGKDHQADNPIKLGKNLKSASMTIDPTKVITRLIPLGAQIEPPQNENGNVANGTRPRITIADLNGGKDYLDIPDLQQEFGIINGIQIWDDVHEPQNLLRKANEWIQAQSATNTQWTISAIELPEYSTFKVSDRYLFINPGIVEPQMLRVTQKQIDLTKPYESSLTIAEKTYGLTEYQTKIQRSLRKIDDLRRLQQSNASQISQLRQENQVLVRNYRNLYQANEQLATEFNEIKDLVDKMNDANKDVTEPFNGDWTPVVKHAADLMKVELTSDGLKVVLARIKQESGGDQTIVNNWDSNAQAGHPTIGLLQYRQDTFDYWAIDGYQDIRKGFHQLLALFNDTNWLRDISVSGGWGPTGKKRFTKLPQ